MAPAASRIKLLVGLDYGTTYTGICFALSTAADFKDIVPWTKYPGAFSHSAEHSVKAPSRIAFPEENLDLSGPLWGYQVEPGMRSCAMTKLLLDKSALLSEFDDCDVYDASANNMMRLPPGKTAKDVVTEFLRQIFNMFEKSKKELFGAMNLNELPVEFWLTVPASWSEAAKHLTKAAAKDAGFGKRDIDEVMLISEPEAAAQYALKSSLHHLETFVQQSTGVMVCDCGGGTVDITTYEIEEVQPGNFEKYLSVLVTGKCGATFVDRNFFKLMTDRFGDAFTSLGPEQIGPGSTFMDHFEQRKKDFSRDNASRRAIRIPLFMPGLKYSSSMDKFYEKRSSSVLLTHEDFKLLFSPVVKTILSLIDDQVYRTQNNGETPITTIVLVGGFAASPYLRESIQQWCEGNSIRLSTPISGAWSAIVCGAVLRGLEGSAVREKKCRRHYGIQLNIPYDPSVHDGFDKSKRHTYIDEFTDEKFLTGFARWQLNKGEKIHRDTTINCDAFYTRCGSPPFAIDLELLSCNLDDAPDTIECSRLEKVGCVNFELAEKQLAQAKKLVKGGTTYYKVHVVINVRLNDDSGHLIYRVMQDGMEIGRANLKLDD